MEIHSQYKDFVYDDKSGIYIANAHLKANRFSGLHLPDNQKDLELDINFLPNRTKNPTKQDLTDLLGTIEPTIPGHSPRIITPEEYEEFANWLEKNDKEAYETIKDTEILYDPKSNELLIGVSGEITQNYGPLTDFPFVINMREVLEPKK